MYMFHKIISALLQNSYFFVCFLQTGQAKVKERDNNKRRKRVRLLLLSRAHVFMRTCKVEKI